MAWFGNMNESALEWTLHSSAVPYRAQGAKQIKNSEIK